MSLIWQQMNHWRESPPLWVQVPAVATRFLVVPAITLTLLTYIITRISPQPQRWSRFVVVVIMLSLTLRYTIWRATATLVWDEPRTVLFSVGLFALELFVTVSGVLQLFLLLRVRDRRREADHHAQAVLAGEFMPTVDVLIPTYNEPEFILRRTVMGCQAMDYPRKKIYLLDDTRRPEIRQLAMELGCHYMTRPDNRHAKAGNLNHAIAQTEGELLVCFDADFVPTRNFLLRTVGFFQDAKVALVQTPQSYYSADPLARNLGLENILVPEQEVFYRQVQPVRDAAESVICAGTSFVMRRQALEQVGGEFVTSSLSEDYFTSLRLAGHGYRLVYLDEKLSAGAAPDDMAALATQRLRWAQGTLQAFFIRENPLTLGGLRLGQRIAHLTGILHWFTSVARVGFLLAPLLYSFANVIPVRASTEEVVFYFLPQYLVHLTAFSWLSYRTRSSLLADIYDVVLCVPLAATVLRTMVRPFDRGFKVTPKGTQSDRLQFQWRLALPLLVLFGLTAISLWRNLGNCLMALSSYESATAPIKGLDLGWLWSAYNLLLLGVSLLVLLDVPRADVYEWFGLRRTVKLEIAPKILCQLRPPEGWHTTLWGVTTNLSEVGAMIALTQSGIPALPPDGTLPVRLRIMEDALELEADVVQTGWEGGFPTVRVHFRGLTLERQRALVELLFCRPGQWRRQDAPGELGTLWVLLRSIVRPRAFFGDRQRPSVMAVTQG
jgi:cellulose synthase (UDP-forming)